MWWRLNGYTGRVKGGGGGGRGGGKVGTSILWMNSWRVVSCWLLLHLPHTRDKLHWHAFPWSLSKYIKRQTTCRHNNNNNKKHQWNNVTYYYNNNCLRFLHTCTNWANGCATGGIIKTQYTHYFTGQRKQWVSSAYSRALITVRVCGYITLCI